MTAMTIENVQARIASIEARFAEAFPTANTSAAASSSASQFASALSTASVGGSADGARVVADAQQYLGIPYKWGGTDPATGLDCSGLTQRVFADLGISIPRVAADQANVGTKVASLADAQPGDLVFFGSPAHHVGIYVGGGQMLEAPHTGAKVRISSLNETPTSIRRVVGTSSQASTATATPYQPIFAAAASRTGVPESLLEAVAKQESGFNPQAVSTAGAQGIMQLMPATASHLGVSDPFNASQSINAAADYLKTLLDKFHSTPLALAAYNAGPGTVMRYGGIPPYSETQNYVKNVLSTMGKTA